MAENSWTVDDNAREYVPGNDSLVINFNWLKRPPFPCIAIMSVCTAEHNPEKIEN